MYWFTNQQFCVKWGSVTSCSFFVSNGLRQGGILSPKLFNVYFDELSALLSNSGKGCSINNVVTNHFSYADDMSILAPFSKGLQTLLDTCSDYAKRYEVTYNTLKTVCMCILPKKLKLNRLPNVLLNNKCLQYVSSYKYLGFIISDDFTDDQDIKRQMRSVYTKANMLNMRFHKCDYIVKVNLFQCYCTNFYCSQLWWNYGSNTYSKIKVDYNNSLRRFLGYNYGCSVSGMCLENNIEHFEVARRKFMHKFIKRVLASQNQLIGAIVSSTFMYLRSSCSREWQNRFYGK